MLVIRLSKTGRTGEAKFRVVVKEKRSNRDGAAIDMLGSVEKKVGKINKNIDTEKLAYWKSKGAQISPSLEKILSA